MSDLSGKDEHLYGDYVRWKRNRGWWIGPLLVAMLIFVVVGFVYLLVYVGK